MYSNYRVIVVIHFDSLINILVNNPSSLSAGDTDQRNWVNGPAFLIRSQHMALYKCVLIHRLCTLFEFTYL